MKLRGQLLLVTSLVVVLPLLGLQFVAQVEELLRRGQEQALLDSARALANVLPRPEPQNRRAAWDPAALYLHTARQPLLLDGYGDDWAAWLDVTERLGPDGREQRASVAPPDRDAPVSLALARSPAGLHLLLQVFDGDTRFAGPDGTPGDHVELRFSGPAGRSTLRIVPAAPGRFTRVGQPGGWPVVHGVWQAVARGWNLELRIPLRDRPEALGVSVFDVDDPDTNAREYSIAGRVPLVARDPEISSALDALLPGGMRAWLVTGGGYVLGHADHGLRAGAAAAGPPSFWQSLLFERLAGAALSVLPPPAPFAARIHGPDLDAARAGGIAPLWMMARNAEKPGARVRVALPLARPAGAGSNETANTGNQSPLLVVERDADALLVLASDAVLRLTAVSLLIFAATAAVLLAFAWRLSARIRRLQRSAENAVADDGKVVAAPVRLRGSDEIAALSASMASLMDRLRTHQQYLGTLADRLSHELRTPLTMIGSSLDNLSGQVDGGERFDPQQARLYLERAEQGNRRLNRIFRAMSQAARLEEALIDEPFECFDLGGLVRDYCAARRPACASHRLETDIPEQAVVVRGSPDLIAQLLDKLVDNALDFAPPGTQVLLRVGRVGDKVRLEVENEGPPIDPSTAAELFEPMVSWRRSGKRGSGRSPADADQPHLGLGLFIARLIAERHGGSMRAEATSTGSRFGLELSRAEPGNHGPL
ncbi:MAG: hypothetical protein KGY53_01620 [Wenzhouxiangellaceae bacterium]|nr:hypothetical protein [Wenzhouxiangellaceae bacterium]